MKIHFTVDATKPHTHYLSVQMLIEGCDENNLVLVFPVWSPGSYLVREYQSQLEGLSALSLSSSKRVLKYRKISKNKWQIDTQGHKKIQVNYRVYTPELNVRSCYLDHQLAFFNPTALFFHPERRLKSTITLKVNLPKGWKGILASNNARLPARFNHFDEFYDAPFLAAPLLTIKSFNVKKTKYRLAFWGAAQADLDQITRDVKKIVTVQTETLGSNPCKNYLFQILFVKGKYGGLEHLFGSTNIFDGTLLSDKKSYRELLALLSHEHFHLWNVKRIRPYELGPFDYSRENYTLDLWMAEGITSYFDDLFVYRAGLMSQDEYLENLATNINKYENQYSKKTDSLSSSSFDSWTRFYRPTENSMNQIMSYYLKGGLVSQLLDFQLIKKSKGKKNFNHLLCVLYQRYLENPQVGISRTEFWNLVGKLAPIDTKEFLKKYIDGTTLINWDEEFKQFGFKLTDKEKTFPYYLGVTLGVENNRLMIKTITEQSPAYHSALRAGDEILAVNEERILTEKQLDPWFKKQNWNLLYSRHGRIFKTQLELQKNQTFNKKIEPLKKLTAQQKKYQKIWLKK